MHFTRLGAPRLAMALVWATLGGVAFACRPTVVPAPTPVPTDPFAVVRATSQAAYASGKAHLDRGELQQALIDLDAAKTNDPDTRPEIDTALGAAVSQLAAQTPTLEPTPVPRAIIVATVPATRPTSVLTPGTTTPASRTTSGAAAATPPGALTPGPVAPDAPTPGAAAQGRGSTELVAWRDPQGRFTLSAPGDWTRSPQPASLFGTSVVQFQDPSLLAEVDVAVDGATRAVSPELYAAGRELAMQQQVPGYAAEQTLPATTSGNPSVRRVYTFTRRDSAGDDTQARGFQVAVVKGSTAYLISGSAPADQFAGFSAAFDQMVETFQFS